MSKGYWIAHVDVSNPEGYKEYVALNAKAFGKYGAKFLVRGGQHVAKEGQARARHVVLEFKDYATALACYESPEYQEAVRARLPHSQANLIIIEGYEG
jgi:uncharacterized protein (DUF1330 family)